MSGWNNVPAGLLGDLRPGISRLVQQVYRQRGKTPPASSLSSYWNMVQVSYNVSQPSTSYIQVARGWSAGPGASMVYSINAQNRTVKLKDEGNRYVPLDTAEFDDLLDKVTKLVHSTHQERMEAADIERKLESRAAAERAAREAAESVTRQLAEKQREEQAQQADKLEYERKLLLLYTKVEAETAQEGWLDMKLHCVDVKRVYLSRFQLVSGNANCMHVAYSNTEHVLCRAR